MSASQKKKARREELLANMTERQRKEAQEAKKLKGYTLSFWIVLALCVCIVLSTIAINPIKNVIYSNNDALTVGDHTLTSVELNYYYIDAVNDYYNQYGQYATLFGLDVKKPLSEQEFDKESGKTWADNFLDMATETIRQTYGLYDLAMSKGHKLTEDEQKNLDDGLATLEVYAMYYGYSNLDGYLRAVYGNGANEESYAEYMEVNAIADSYYNSYYESLDYSDADMRDYESKEDRYHTFSSVTYSTYYLHYTKWAPVKDKDGKTINYTEEQLNEARENAKKAAELLAATNYESIEAFNEAIKNLEINNGVTTGITATENKDTLISSIGEEEMVKWLTSADRKANDTDIIPSKTTEGEKEVINGYYVIRFENLNENKFALKNVRHILIQFKGGKTDATTGKTTYTEAEKKVAKDEAEKLYKQWQDGAATEDSFAELANKESDDQGGKVTNGGIYEDIYPGQMVPAFEDWCYAEGRKAGDTGIVETEYGYHIMYFSGDSEVTYRDLMVESQMINENVTEWVKDLTEATKLTMVSDKYVNKDLVLSSH